MIPQFCEAHLPEGANGWGLAGGARQEYREAEEDSRPEAGQALGG